MELRGWSERRWVRVLLPVAFVAAGATLQGEVLAPLGSRTTYVALFLGVVLSAVLGGLLSGVVATALSAVFGVTWLREGAHELGDWLAVGVFLAGGLAVSAICEASRRTRARLARNERLLDQMGRTARVGGWAIDVASNRLEWTEETRSIHEVPQGFVPDLSNAIGFYHPDDRPAISEAVRKAVEGGEPFDLELRLVTALGNVRWVRSMGHALVEGGGAVEVVGSFQDVTKRHEAEEALRASEEKHRLLAENAAELVAVIGADGVLRYLSPASLALAGYSPEELVGQRVSELLVVPEDVPVVERATARHDSGEELVEARYRIRRKDGRVIWVEWRTRAVRDAATGKVLELHAVVRDVTEAVETETELKRHQDHLEELVAERTARLQASEERLRLAQQAARSGSYEWDLRTDEVSWSPELEHLYGLPTGGFERRYGKGAELVHPDDRAAANAMLRKAAAEGTGFHGEFRIVRPDGETRWMEAFGRAVPDGSGKAVRMVGLNRDITERKEAELRLSRQEALLSLAQKAARAGTWSFDAATGRSYWSREMFSLRGIDSGPGEIAYADVVRLVHPDDRAAAEEAFARTLARQEAMHLEYRVIRLDGEAIWIRSVGDVLRDAEGRGTGMAGLDLDVTETKRAEEEVRASRDRLAAANAELAKAARMKDEFLASMSHEMRTPLTAIVGTAEYLCSLPEGALSPDALRHVESIGTSGRRLEEMVDEILDVARLDAGRVKAESEKCLAADVVAAAARRYRAAAAEKGQELAVSSDPEGLVLSTDAARLAQLLGSLLSNAVKFTPPGGRIDVTARGDEDAGVARISVRDTGIGIAAGDVSRLFSSFVQLDGRTERAYGGIGLGLALVKRLAQLLGGTIAVESTVGRGTCFTLTLPWTERAVASAPGAPRTPPSGTRPTPRDASGTGLARRVPAELRAALHAAVERADADEIEALAGRLAERDADAARLVRELARSFDYESLLRELGPNGG